jgi:hypothetical protein
MHSGVFRRRSRWPRTAGLTCAVVGTIILAGCTDGPTQPQLREPSGHVLHSGEDPYCGFGGWGDCTLEPITSAPGDGCVSPATQIDYCQGGSTGNTGDTGTWGGTGGTTTGGATGNPPPPEDTIPKDSCRTGSPVFDDPTFRAGLADLWQKSNADANLAQRKEQFGWVVRTATGYRIAYLGAGNFCGFDGTVPAPAEGYAAVTGFIHTHPYEAGEIIVSCDANMSIGTAVYHNDPSTIDRTNSISLGNALGRPGPLPGVIVDKNRLTLYAGMDSTTDVPQRRCGY